MTLHDLLDPKFDPWSVGFAPLVGWICDSRGVGHDDDAAGGIFDGPDLSIGGEGGGE